MVWGTFMGMNKSVLRLVFLLGSHLTNQLAADLAPATIPLNNDERPVKWIPMDMNHGEYSMQTSLI